MQHTAVKAGLSERMKKHAFDAFEMKGLRKILRVSWTAKKTNEWVLKGTLHSVEKTLIQKAYCVYYHILKERRFFYVD